MPRRKPSKWLTTVLLLLLGGFYWAFYHDPAPTAALAFFYPVETVGDEDNAIYTIAGFAAPADAADPRAWGYARFHENRQRVRERKPARQLLTRWDPVDGAARLVGMRDKGHFCWSLEGLTTAESRHCYREHEIGAALEANRLLLARYETLFDYPAIETWQFDDIPLAALLDYTSLFAWRFWRARDALEADDRHRLFRFYRFWHRLHANAVSNHADRTMILMNYTRASELISRLAERDPGLLDDYAAGYGDFAAPIAAQDLLDRMLRQEFRTLDRLYCLRARFGVSDDCRPRSLRFPGKLGATVAQLYRERPRADQCATIVSRPARRATRESRREFIWRDPTNISGGFLLTTLADAAQLCLALREYQVEAETALLRNFYLEFRRRGWSPARLDREYAAEPLLFANPYSQNEIRWDATGQRLVMRNRRVPGETVIPYAAPGRASPTTQRARHGAQ